MQITAKIKLVVGEQLRGSLFRTIPTANACCEWLSELAWAEKTFNKFAIQNKWYYEARETFPTLSSQVIVRCIAKVADAYKKDKKTQRTFEALGAITYDLRILSWKLDSVSIWTVDGRKKIPFVCGERQQQQLQTKKGKIDLLLQDGQFYLGACCEMQEPAAVEPSQFLGVDRGVVNIATDSDGNNYSGQKVKEVRYRHRRLRQRLQKCGSKSAKRHLKKLSGKEARFAKDINHQISKQIVSNAKGTCRGIALENLKGIRDRVTVRKRQRYSLHSWSFAQLESFVRYKAVLAGVQVVQVNTRNSSRECSVCGYTDKANRKTQDKFCCLSCGHKSPADLNAARVIASRAKVNKPIAATFPG